MPPLRRGHHVLGARRDRQGACRDPRVRPRRRPRERSSTRCSPRATSVRGSGSGCFPSWASSPRRRPSRVSCSPRGGGSSRRSRKSDRRSWSSRTFTGRTMALLSFLEHLADSTAGVPMLILGTSRPDLFERRPAFASSAPNAARIHLVALADTETAALATALLGDLAIPDDVRMSATKRAGGNPLFIGELVRLLRDRAIDASEVRGANASDAGVSDDGSLRIPSSIQAVIAARLDALSLATKSLLADAAVVGGVFWSGALVAMGDRSPGEVADGLRQLEAKGARPSQQAVVGRGPGRVRLRTRAHSGRRLRAAAQGLAGRTTRHRGPVDRGFGGRSHRGRRGSARLPLHDGAGAREGDGPC